MAREVRDKYPELALMILAQAQNPLRESLGDEKYASYLEATGRPASVNINRLLPGSAGANAGLREGDIIRSYAGSRVFTRSDLERATFEGDYGEPVTIEVERDGAVFYMTVPRGPIGTSFAGMH
jgi:S1-C subfamily serine protease